MQLFPLDDLSSFQSTTPNWQIVGAAWGSLETDHDMEVEDGTGTIANVQTPHSKGHLFTNIEHQDMELDLEVMMPKGSNSGVYFQSRYEIQLLDSWGVDSPTYNDMGGIYQRWDESRPEGQRGYNGHAPRLNVARAPGLWQHLNILFRAPRFDQEGNKIENARFERVMLNGVVIHENIELTGPTRAAAYKDEVGTAPLMFQGDHGPVAMRNIRYRLFSPESIKISDLELTYYEGAFNHQMPDLSTLSISSKEAKEGITSEDARVEKQFAMQYTGALEIPITGTYTFEVSHTSRVRLVIDGKEVLTDRSDRVNGLREFPRNAGVIELQKGVKTFELVYAKGLWHGAPTALGFFVSGPGLMRAELSKAGSVPHDVFSDFQVRPENEPLLQRNFVQHKGEKRTHAISIGYPSGVNYSYDMSRGALLNIWKGPFVDVSTMWYQRGNMQSALPLGSVIERSGMPSLSSLENNQQPWPDSLENFEFQHYELTQSGEPVFVYSVGATLVTDQFSHDLQLNTLNREINIEGETSDLWVLLADSDSVVQLQPGLYAIDNQKMYIAVEESLEPIVRNTNGKQQLVLPIQLSSGTSRIKYSLIW